MIQILQGYAILYLLGGILINLFVLIALLSNETDEPNKEIKLVGRQINKPVSLLVVIILLIIQLLWPILIAQGILKLWDNKQ